jgi:transketolase
MISKEKVRELERFALEIRIETIRAIGHLGFGHLGGAMSVVEVLAVLYGGVMKIDPANPGWEGRDWLVCSKGHAGPAVYSTLALKGYFPLSMLKTLNTPGTRLPSHCDKNLTPGVDMTTGSLGQGSSAAAGIALGNRLKGRNNKTFLILGDGELQEGQVWEAALFAAQQKLDNLIAFVDYNKQQLDGYVRDINNLGDVRAKFESFGWHAREVDGHSIEQIWEAVEAAGEVKDQPSVIVLHTVKGKGCSFAEGIVDNHHMIVNEQQIKESLAALEEILAGEVEA